MTTDQTKEVRFAPHEFYPELTKPPLADKITVRTLSEIGVKKSSQAEKLGYICVVESKKAGSRTFPGKWVAPDDIPILRELVTPIYRARMLKREADNSVWTERINEIQEKFSNLLPLQVISSLKSEDLKSSMSIVCEKIYCLVREDLSGDFRERWGDLDSSRGVLRLKAEEFIQCGNYKQFRLRVVDACKIMLKGPNDGEAEVRAILDQYATIIQSDNHSDSMDVKLEPFRTVPETLFHMYSPTRPDWLSEKGLWSWAKGKSQSKRTHARVHPAQTALENLKKNGTSPKGIAIHSYGTTIAVPMSIELVIAGTAHIVKTCVEIQNLQERIWDVKEVADINQAIEMITKQETVSFGDKLRTLLLKHSKDLDWTPEKGDKLTIARDEWGSFLLPVLVQTGMTLDIKQITKALNKQAEKRMHDLRVAACARALPERISDLYQIARGMRRKLKLVIGPTNSGKTYMARKRLKAAESSVYLSPLRLLALEVRDLLEAEGCPTSLVTGELVELRSGAACSSRTVEMIDFDNKTEVTVIDEVHMIGDKQRGAAWVQAILGAPSEEVWMLGAPEAEQAVIALAEYLGEPLEIIRTERLGELQIERTPTPFGLIPNQSAIIAFSRRAVLDIAAELKEAYGRECAVVYGALSPEVRRQQAERFRSGEANIIVATDAIAMGLNLPVKGVYFSDKWKWNGTKDELLPRDLTWQIAGRAGRYGLHETGTVGAIDTSTLSFVKEMLSRRPNQVAHKYAHGPSWPLVKTLSENLKSESLAKILGVFQRDLTLSTDRRFYPSIGEEQVRLAIMLDRHPLSLRDKLTLSMAPVPKQKDDLAIEYASFAKAISRRTRVSLSSLSRYCSDNSKLGQENAEYAVKILTLYCWLHYRFPGSFPEIQLAIINIEKLNESIGKHLQKYRRRSCNECNKPLPWKHPHRTCESCYHNRRSYWDYDDRF